MKILHVLASPHLGGAETMCLALAAEQIRSGHAASLFLFRPGAVAERAAKLGIPALLHRPDGNVPAGKQQFRTKVGRALAAAVRQVAPDVVHSHVPLTNLISSRVLPSTGVPWVATIHGSWRQFGYAPETVGRPWLRPYLMLRHAAGDRFATRNAAGITAPSDYVRRQLLQLGIPAARVTTILNGTTPARASASAASLRQQWMIPGGKLIAGALGYFAPVKGFDVLIRAAAYLQHDQVPLHIVIAGGDVLGDNRYRRRLMQLIADLNVRDRVALLDAVDSSAFLTAIDVFCISSRTEGLPLALLEAMHTGKPSVISSEGGSSEAARPDIEGLVFRSGDPRDLADRLRTIAADSRLRESLGQSAAARASTILTIERCAAEYEQLYMKLI